MTATICAIDVETTGLDFRTDDILEIAIIPLTSNYKVDRTRPLFHTIVNPGERALTEMELPSRAMLVNRLSRDVIMDKGVESCHLLALVTHWMKTNDISVMEPLGQFVQFDLKFLEALFGFEQMGIFDRNVRCTKGFARGAADVSNEMQRNNPDWRPANPFDGFKLGQLADHYGTEKGVPHSAVGDAVTAANVYAAQLAGDVAYMANRETLAHHVKALQIKLKDLPEIMANMDEMKVICRERKALLEEMKADRDKHKEGCRLLQMSVDGLNADLTEARETAMRLQFQVDSAEHNAEVQALDNAAGLVICDNASDCDNTDCRHAVPHSPKDMDHETKCDERSLSCGNVQSKCVPVSEAEPDEPAPGLLVICPKATECQNGGCNHIVPHKPFPLHGSSCHETAMRCGHDAAFTCIPVKAPQPKGEIPSDDTKERDTQEAQATSPTSPDDDTATNDETRS